MEKSSNGQSEQPKTSVVVDNGHMKPVFKSYQARAIARKTLIHHKRSWKRDCCCILICPAITMIIAGFLGIIVRTLVRTQQESSNNPIDALFGSNVDGLQSCSITNTNTTPILFPNFNLVPQYKTLPDGNEVQLINFHIESPVIGNIFSGLFGGFGTPAARQIYEQAGSNGLLPCVYAFDKRYTQNAQDAYLPVVREDDIYRLDSTFLPDPSQGWFGIGNSSLNTPFLPLELYQTAPYFYVSSEQDDFLGARPQPPAIENPLASLYAPGANYSNNGTLNETINTSEIPNIRTTLVDSIVSSLSNVSQSNSGLLGNFPTFLFVNVSADAGKWFNITSRGNLNLTGISSNSSLGNATASNLLVPLIASGFNLSSIQPLSYFTYSPSTVNQMDDMLGEDISYVIKLLNDYGLDYWSARPSPYRTWNYPYVVTAIQAISNLPWGSFRFQNRNDTNFQYEMQMGSDDRLSIILSLPEPGLKLMASQIMLTNALLATNNQDIRIVPVYRTMPNFVPTKFSAPLGLLTGKVLYPFGISFLVPVFIFILAQEKENRSLVMMKMNGLRASLYFFAHYVEFLIMSFLAAVVFVVVAACFRLELVSLSLGPTCILLLVWINTQVSLSMAISTMFSKSRTALVFAFLIVLLSIVIAIATSGIWGNDAPNAYFIWPLFAVYAGISIINDQTIRLDAPAMTLPISVHSKLFTVLMFLLVEYFVFMGFAIYGHLIIRTEYGLTRPWYFPFVLPFLYLRDRLRGSHDKSELTISSLNGRKGKKTSLNSGEKQPEAEIRTLSDTSSTTDESVEKERQRSYHANHIEKPLIVLGASKRFGKKQAVDDVTFCVDKNQIMSLLGPNGAGKTSLINLLTGLHPFTSGTAIIGGNNIAESAENICHLVGICPQHEILWPEITVEEHLLFYARLKGIPPNKEKQVVKDCIDQVELWEKAKTQARALSGGQRRRLAIAIAVVGDPRVVFLDEPTTGLDTEVRRQVWRVLHRVKAGRSMILTTHSMEEADNLSAKIAIMVNGSLKTIGTSVELKQLYGRGLKVSILYNGEANSRTDIINFMKYVAPPIVRTVESRRTITFEIDGSDQGIGEMLIDLDKRQAQNGIIEFGIAGATLDEVFRKVIGVSEDDNYECD